jgi:hypothetical protein
MKMNKYRILFLSVIAVLVAVTSCKDESKDPLPLELINNSNGAFLRQTAVTSGAFNFFDLPNSKFQHTVEVSDAEKGGLFASIEYYVQFTDTGGPNSKVEKLIRTIAASEFTPSTKSGLPSKDVTFTLPETATTLGLTLSQIGAGDTFLYRQVIVMKDGKRFTSTNTSNAILQGAVYASPFRNLVAVACPSLLAGTYTYVMTTQKLGVGGSLSACSPSKSGTVVLAGSAGKYVLPDASFGMYACAYNDTPAVGLTLVDICNKLSISGVDQYSVVYTIDRVSVAGLNLTLEISNDYGDFYTVVITRTSGSWPALTN